ncbi:NfeD family protein [Vibrio sp. RC27]
MDYILSNLAQSYVVIGLLLLAIEVLVLGFSTFVLIFVGIGMIAVGVLMFLGVFPETVMNSLLATAIISTLVALFSWKPMKRLQNKVDSTKTTNDMIGHRFFLTDELLVGHRVNHRYSGIEWKVKAKQPIEAGTEVQIVHMEVGLLTVERVD